jgi:hypothetical protein
VILNGLEPNPSFAVDRHWNLIAANRSVGVLLSEVDGSLLEPPVNILRLCLHPKGFTSQVINYSEWRDSIFEFLNRLITVSADAFLIEMMRELKSYPQPKPIKNNLTPEEKRQFTLCDSAAADDQTRRAFIRQHDHRFRHPA